MCIYRHVLLHVWALLAPFTWQICVSSSFTVFHWLQFLSLQRSGLKADTWLTLETKASLAKHCLCPWDPSQPSGSFYGSWDIRFCLCTGCGCCCAFPRGLCCYDVLCTAAAQLSTRQQAVSSLILSSSHSWSIEILIWSDRSPCFHPLT